MTPLPSKVGGVDNKVPQLHATQSEPLDQFLAALTHITNYLFVARACLTLILLIYLSTLVLQTHSISKSLANSQVQALIILMNKAKYSLVVYVTEYKMIIPLQELKLLFSTNYWNGVCENKRMCQFRCWHSYPRTLFINQVISYTVFVLTNAELKDNK